MHLSTIVLELAHGKYGVEVTYSKDLSARLDAIKSAIFTCELGTQIDAAANNLCVGFTHEITEYTVHWHL